MLVWLCIAAEESKSFTGLIAYPAKPGHGLMNASPGLEWSGRIKWMNILFHIAGFVSNQK
jgi:hypothetical protein